MLDYFFRLFIFFLINAVVSFIVDLLIPNVNLATFISSIIIAFIFTWLYSRGKGIKDFLADFFITATCFLVLDGIMLLLL